MSFWFKHYISLRTLLGDNCRTRELKVKIRQILDGYFDPCKERAWTQDEYSEAENYILDMSDDLGKKIHTTLSVIEILKYKSTLTVLADDFPSISETLYYSPLMCQLDQLIDSWIIKKEPPVCDYNELYRARTTKAQIKLPHSWWNVLDTVDKVHGELYRESRYAVVRNKNNNRIDVGISKALMSKIGSFTNKTENMKQMIVSFGKINENTTKKDAIKSRLTILDEQIMKTKEDNTSILDAHKEMDRMRNAAVEAALKIEQNIDNEEERDAAVKEFLEAENVRIEAEAAFSELMYELGIIYK